MNDIVIRVTCFVFERSQTFSLTKVMCELSHFGHLIEGLIRNYAHFLCFKISFHYGRFLSILKLIFKDVVPSNFIGWVAITMVNSPLISKYIISLLPAIWSYI